MKNFLPLVVVSAFLLGACATPVKIGGGSSGPAYGSANTTASGTTSSGSVELRRCSKIIATVEVSTEQNQAMLIQYGLPGNPLPAMRLIAQQSGCFRVVNRDVALKAMKTERELTASGELKAGSKFHKGQVTPSDYTILVEVILNNQNAGGAGGLLGGMLGAFIPGGQILGMAAGGINTSEAEVVLTLVNNRTSEQETATTGKASGISFGALGGVLGGGVLAGAGGYQNTDQGKVVMGAMVDATNQLIPYIESATPKL